MEQFLTPPALARRLGVAEATVYRWINKGTIPTPAISLGGCRGYTMSAANEIAEWWEERRRVSDDSE